MKYNDFFSIPQFIVLLLITCGLSISVKAEYFEISSSQMRLWADHIVVNRDTIEARGDVYIRQAPYSIYAGYIHIDLNTKDIIAERSVLAEFKDACISGNRFLFNIDSRKGVMYQGTFFYEPGPLYIQGNKIEKTDEHSYYVDKILVTGCDLCNPDWSISGNDVHITIDGYARMWHGRMSVKNVPIFYMPFFIFPVKQSRQTGLLFPFVEHSSRKGWLYQQPFYWAIGKSVDATLYTTYMEKRGIMNGLEFRYNTGPQSQGTFMIDYLDDRQQETLSQQFQWGFHNDHYLRTDSKRYWFRMKLDQPMFYKTMLNMDADWISDPDYLKAFDSSYSGFDKSRNNLFQRHHRDLDDAHAAFRFNRMNLQRRFDKSKIYGEFQWFDDVYHQNSKASESPIQQLPVVRFSRIQSPLFLQWPIFIDLDSLYAFEYQHKAEKNHHVYLSTGLTCPINFIPFIFIEQSYQWKGGYSHSHSHPTSAQQNLFKTSITSELYKIYSFGSNHAKRKAKKEFKHSIRLVTTYTHVSEIDENRKQFRLFDEKTNKINWLFSNTWIEKIEKQSTHKESSIAMYKQRVKLAFSGDYDILEKSDKSLSDQNKPRAVSPIKMDFFWHTDHVSFNADALWSVYDDEIFQYHISLTLDDKNDRNFKIHYQYYADKNEAIDTELSAQLYPKLKVLAAYAHDIHNNQRIEHGFGFEYRGPCWRLKNMLTDNADTDDRRVSVMIHLDGISN